VPDALVGDVVRLRQILNNLVGNAIKFTERGRIAVRVKLPSAPAAPGELHFTISDTGIGISAEKLPAIFQAFTQADSSITRQYGGTGLGLSITARLVEMMHGRIWVESEPGQGSHFHFTVQMAVSTKPASTAREPDVLIEPDELPEGAGNLPPLRVLVAEDNPVNREMMIAVLAGLGHRVEIVRDGHAVLAALEREQFDVVLMDLQMPQLDGLATTRAIRQREASQQLTAAGAVAPVQIIAVTAHAMYGDRATCLAAGMNDYVAKPVRRRELLAALQRVFPAKLPAAPAPETEPALDAARLKVETRGQPDLLQRLAAAYFEQAAGLQKTIQTAAANRQMDALHGAVHILRGSLAQFAAGPALPLALRLETAAVQMQAAEVDVLVPELFAELQRFEAELRELLAASHKGD